MRFAAAKLKSLVIIPVVVIVMMSITAMAADGHPLHRPVATYSIVARHAVTGEMSFAVQSHWFSGGTIVACVELSVGAVATQSLADPACGPRGLSLMRSGKTAPGALTSLLAPAENRNVRQVAMVDTNGSGTNHTGENSIAEYCDHLGDSCSVQANMMWKPTVCTAMSAEVEPVDPDIPRYRIPGSGNPLLAWEATHAVEDTGLLSPLQRAGT